MADEIKKNKILVVDDDPMNILIVEEMLRDHYELKTASDEESALNICEIFKPDLILLDLTLQFTNGYDLCRKLKSNQASAFTKIILISSKALLKDRLFGYQAGADDYLSKPFDRDELFAKVRIFIRLKSVEEIDRVKDDLINVFSHETRTPLNAIIGFTKLLKDSPSITGEEQEFVDLILESGYSLLNLSNKAILLSNLKKGSTELNTTMFMAKRLMEMASLKIPQSLLHKNITVEDLTGDAGGFIDPKLGETALSYLLDNAYRFSPKDGSISVKAENNQHGDFIIAVSDSGPGIEPDRLAKIFDEFGIDDVAHHGRGHGLSLSIVKQIMLLHGGAVKAENNQNKQGCTIKLVFPQNPSISAA
ncbi:MAG: hypothetical protein A2020_01615 [Lentisphaerae bacterium GWF2_45_14]|nr:MAG: hypothetical protein A2020_01615 [Lentisphaerae bacterium GWF2_45_14]